MSRHNLQRRNISWRTLLLLGLTILCVASPAAPAASLAADQFRWTDITAVRISPETVQLDGPHASFSLLVDGQHRDGRTVDLTAEVTFVSRNPQLATVTDRGVVHSRSDGTTLISVSAGEKTFTIPVTVRNSAAERKFNFENDIVPLLNKFGCNTSGCHGKAEGQNGFKLSVFGSDPDFDYQALTQESRSRRINIAQPDLSLLLGKASGKVPHGGGVRIGRDSAEYRTLLEWVSAGLPFGSPSDPQVVSITVTPAERTMAPRTQQQLRVVAAYSDGKQVDVTPYARFQTNNDGLANVSEAGLVTTGDVPGDVAIMANFMGAVQVFRVLLPRTEKIDSYPQLTSHNFIDQLVQDKLKKLNIIPSGVATDAEYLRRVYLDILGTLPTAQETRAFLQDTRPDKRARLVDALLERPEYADFWALKWADVLRVNRQTLGHKKAYSYYKWIRDSLAANKPYDQFCREIVTAAGPLDEAPAGHLFKVVTKPGEMASTISQVFLGVRIECAQCHHHPFDRWSQTDYFGMQAFFTQVSFKGTPDRELLIPTPSKPTTHPRTGQVVYAHALGTPMPEAEPDGDRRQILAAWMTAPDNAWFSQNLVNRVWAHFLGRGLVEPVDDFRLTNPATHPALLEALAQHFVEQKFDLKQLIRTIAASRTYQLSSQPNPTNERDDQNYSRALFKRLDAEVLLDAVCQVTGVDEKFPGVPAGYRAIQLWDSQVNHYFLRLFGRPTRNTACECERAGEPTVAQVLHVLNSPEIQAKLSHAGGRLAQLTQQHREDGQLVDELYLTFYSRFPTPAERTAATTYLKKQAEHRPQAVEDLAWSLMNTAEFLFNR